MARSDHEIPTHLDVEDKVVFGLTVRQLLYLMVGLSLGYGLWEQQTALLPAVRLGLAGACVLAAAIFVLVRPFGRPLEQWLVAGACFVALPRQATWRPAELDPADWRPGAGDWQELAPDLAWYGDGTP